MFLRALEDGVQPPVAAQPGEGPFNHPADAGRNTSSIMAAGNHLGGDTECLTEVGQPLAPIAQIAERRTLEASLGERAQNWDDAFRVMPVRRRDIATNPSTSANASHGPGDVFAGRTAVPRMCGSGANDHGCWVGSSRFRPPAIQSVVAIEHAQTRRVLPANSY
jgi:hypothetical protein